MRFCPSCDVKLRKGIDGLTCPKCGYAEDAGEQGGSQAPPQSRDPDTAALGAEPAQDAMSGLDIPDDGDDDAAETRPTIQIECEKCGNNEAVWWMLQTRSADEPTTQFYRCTKCEHTWRDYS